MMKTLLTLLLSFCGSAAFCQQLLKGVVLDAEKGTPVPAASIFLNNTSVGTTTNAQGNFTLSLPMGRFDLIVSSIGYETSQTNILAGDKTDFITIRLQPKAKELETVVVEPFEQDGWKKWGLFFTENFIGTFAQAKECHIINSKAIKFRHSKKNNELTAHALEPLLIENKALGYTVRYQLESFSYNFKTGYLSYQGYPYFEPHKGGSAKQRRWQHNQKAAYEGSMLHFMRSLYRNVLQEEGFEVRALVKMPNAEKQRVKLVYDKSKQAAKSNGGTITVQVGAGITADSTAYYQSVLRQADYFDILGRTLLRGDSIAYAIDSTTAGLFFENYLLVIYNKKMAPPEYTKHHPDNGMAMASRLLLLNGNPVEIYANGSFYDPLEIVSSGYWAWSEKLSTMLPYDFNPSTGKTP